MKLSQIKDVDYDILNRLDDESLIAYCQVDKAANSLCNDDRYWLSRIRSRFPTLPQAEMYRRGNKTWAKYYIEDLRPLMNSQEYGPLLKHIRFAVINGRIDILMAYVYHNININLIPYISTAIEHGQLEVLQYFGALGLEIISEDYLKLAIENNHLDIVKYQIENGADPIYPNNMPLRYAVQKNNIKMVDYLITRGANRNVALEAATEYGTMMMLTHILDTYTDIDINQNNNRALINTIYRRKIDHVRLLLDRGSDPNFLLGRPLLAAIRNEDIDIVNLLIDRGADVTVNNNEASIVAVAEGYLEILKLLVSRGANPIDPAANNEALFNAVYEYHFDIVKYLVELGAPITQEIISEATSQFMYDYLIENKSQSKIEIA